VRNEKIFLLTIIFTLTILSCKFKVVQTDKVLYRSYGYLINFEFANSIYFFPIDENEEFKDSIFDYGTLKIGYPVTPNSYAKLFLLERAFYENSFTNDLKKYFVTIPESSFEDLKLFDQDIKVVKAYVNYHLIKGYKKNISSENLTTTKIVLKNDSTKHVLLTYTMNSNYKQIITFSTEKYYFQKYNPK